MMVDGFSSGLGNRLGARGDFAQTPAKENRAHLWNTSTCPCDILDDETFQSTTGGCHGGVVSAYRAGGANTIPHVTRLG